ncbi:7576_t:CDS:2 [Funneliformis mosseae]|uniref:7576_t:CDS:1 n=1 Tax=Funneliformis mosseae TaxID=27381 RepID=A0A9N9BAF6_FUNMO|nr:7576_t:CDS:2 [Funneliformis mosseae]
MNPFKIYARSVNRLSPISRQFIRQMSSGKTHISIPYYTPLGPYHTHNGGQTYLIKLLDNIGLDKIESIKFDGPVYSLFPDSALKETIELIHRRNIEVSTGGLLEQLCVLGTGIKDSSLSTKIYLKKCKEVGFDYLEINNLFDNIILERSYLSRIVNNANSIGLKLKAKICIFKANMGIPGIQIFKTANKVARCLNYSDDESSDDSDSDNYNGTVDDVMKKIHDQYDFLTTLIKGSNILIASDGIFQNIPLIGHKKEQWFANILDRMTSDQKFENVTYEAPNPEIFTFLLDRYSSNINLLVDYSHAYHVSRLRKDCSEISKLIAQDVMQNQKHIIEIVCALVLLSL